VQTHLFDQHDRERSQKLMAAIDMINTEWGSGTIRYAAVGLRPAWIMYALCETITALYNTVE